MVNSLLAHRMEVRDMLLAEYNEKLHIDNEKEISFEAGVKEGLAKGELIKLIKLIVQKMVENLYCVMKKNI